MTDGNGFATLCAMTTKVTVTTVQVNYFSTEQLALMRRLASEGSEYLHGDEARLADITIGITDSGEGCYSLTRKGYAIINEVDKTKNKNCLDIRLTIV